MSSETSPTDDDVLTEPKRPESALETARRQLEHAAAEVDLDSNVVER